MALLDALLGKKDKTTTDVIVEPTATLETKVTPTISVTNDISLATAITGETEAIIYATEE